MKTDFAKEIILIAHRVLAEQASGRAVDPLRLEWARTIIKSNTPTTVPTPAPETA